MAGRGNKARLLHYSHIVLLLCEIDVFLTKVLVLLEHCAWLRDCQCVCGDNFVSPIQLIVLGPKAGGYCLSWSLLFHQSLCPASESRLVCGCGHPHRISNQRCFWAPWSSPGLNCSLVLVLACLKMPSLVMNSGVTAAARRQRKLDQSITPLIMTGVAL